MSLRLKTAIVIISLYSIIIVSEFIVQRYFVYNAFVSIEKEEAADNMARITQALENEVSHLDNLNNDWATWDDTYNFIDNRSEDYIVSNLPDWIFHESGMDLIYIVNNNGEVVWGKIYDTALKKEIFVKEIPQNMLPQNHSLLIRDYRTHDLSLVKKRGLFNTEKGPLLISTELILTSKGKGPPKGYMIMGLFIDDKVINKIKDQTKVNFEVIYLYNKPGVEAYKDVINELVESKLYIDDNETNKDYYNLYRYYTDVEKDPSLIIKVDFPRKISGQGKKVITFATTYLILTGIIVLILIIILINKYALKPLQMVDKYMVKIIKSNDFSIRINSKRKDEIGIMANAFDFFVAKIEEQKQMLEDLSTIDGLTNIANRRKFDETIKSEWNRHKRFGSTITILLLDVDYFKLYNDFYGHQAGDECLKKICSVLSNHTKRAGELSARYGGEEFVLLYLNSEKQNILEICDHIKSDINKLNIKHEKSKVSDRITVSIGIAIYKPKSDDKYIDFINNADKALYQAKEAGRNRAVLYNSTIIGPMK